MSRDARPKAGKGSGSAEAMPYAQVLRLGVLILPEHRLPGLAEKWSRAEVLGFDHAWTYDHIAWRELRDSAWFAAVPTLAAAAMVTSRIRLGTLVASPSFRHPVPFARELLTLHHIAGGRLTVGVGAGAQAGTKPSSARNRGACPNGWTGSQSSSISWTGF
jgi:alkanesulfonate monooxygenase SsuD/methylene tetrahydromethanopterin reductase-like flavin-dependent oxidoreductase (luciferase family)